MVRLLFIDQGGTSFAPIGLPERRKARPCAGVLLFLEDLDLPTETNELSSFGAGEAFPEPFIHFCLADPGSQCTDEKSRVEPRRAECLAG